MYVDDPTIFKHKKSSADRSSLEFFGSVNANRFILLFKLDVIHLIALQNPGICARSCQGDRFGGHAVFCKGRSGFNGGPEQVCQKQNSDKTQKYGSRAGTGHKNLQAKRVMRIGLRAHNVRVLKEGVKRNLLIKENMETALACPCPKEHDKANVTPGVFPFRGQPIRVSISTGAKKNRPQRDFPFVAYRSEETNATAGKT
jgi:hypothetical protein